MKVFPPVHTMEVGAVLIKLAFSNHSIVSRGVFHWRKQKTLLKGSMKLKNLNVILRKASNDICF